MFVCESVSVVAAQNVPVYQSGLSVRGHGSMWVSHGVVEDAGTAGAGNVTELGITNSGTPFCVNDTLTTNPTGYHQFCVGAMAFGGGLMNYGAHGGAAALPMSVSTDGPIIFSSATNTIEAKNLPTGSSSAVQLCINPTTGALSMASASGCGGVSQPGLLLVGGDTTSCILVGGDTTSCILAD